MDPVVIIAIVFLMLALITTLVTLYIESRKRTRRLEGRIERLSSRIQSMSMKELDTVLKSIKYKKERDELCRMLDEINQTVEAMEDGRQIKLLPKGYLDKSNKLMTYEWEDGNARYTSYYTYNPYNPYNPSHDSTNTNNNTPSQDSSNYTGGEGDFSGGGSGGSWD